MASLAFTGHGIDRADHVRADPERLAECRASPQALVLDSDGLAPKLGKDRHLLWRSLDGLGEKAELVFLGIREGAPLFAEVPTSGDDRPAYQQRPVWREIALLPAQDLAIYGGARSLMDWHARHRFCSRCGKPTQIAKGGWQRNCPACEAQHFPRTDPVTIMLVEHEDALLLGRGLNFPERRYSALAGFVEPGESMEEAVVREVLEEAGVTVRDVSYIASQPWPFPSQLMIGCHAMAEGRELTVDTTELADADWFSRAEVAAAMGGDEKDESLRFLPPPETAIAHHLLKWWLERGRD
ncbi:NAD(+) diphosphatase [Alteraurantiacibacter aquimixticola]|uniref:NAD(+) diphosphatase n=1 Tax=Alteraurantiacibacter aquimixticola TaxID=2489173 RepID=A0A4T3F0H2_9SPHN|nr:NAD(+) diphosphatase [Alteraurantiacibacter aquimixticola]TIX50529.1 NAD(+) diphosphatase [Alteraurantiacibacter aquimixticola]